MRAMKQVGGATVQPVVPRPPFWMRLSIMAGNLLQLAGLAAGSGVLYLAVHWRAGTFMQVALMILGWLIIYICCHSLAHWLVGRLVGIRFRGYGIRGTDHPEELGTILRALLTRLPMFTAITDKQSMQRASPLAKALMFAAGETSTILCVILVGVYVWQSHIPGGVLWLIIPILMSVEAVISTSRMPRGDYAKARRALHGNSQAGID
jgi:hypothetical protein